MTEPTREPAPWVGPSHASLSPPDGRSWPYAPLRQAPTGLAIASIALAIALTVVELGTAVASGPAAKDFRKEVELGGSSFDVFTAYDALELFLFPVMVAAYVVSCLWLQFARANTLAIDAGAQHQRRPIWTWLGWWVPIVSFWFPYQVVRDVRDNSIRGGKAPGLGLWWTAWLVYIIGNRASSRASASDSLGTIDALPVFEAITSVAAVVACVQWCRLVNSITASQRLALARS